MNKKKKVIFDMLLNIIAATIPIAILQFLVYPMTAKAVGGDEYGLMLTIYSIWIMVSNSLGNVLNNIRLLRNNEYQEKHIQGDFIVLLKRWSAINSLIICSVIIFYCKEFNIEHVILGIIVSLLIIVKAYTEVGFRLVLNYKAILANNMLQSLGFVVGAYITKISGIWEAIFILGYLFSCIFCITKTKLLSESNEKTILYSDVSKDTNKLIIATIISNMMNYADKLVLYPLMGGYAVSIYYTATILGKMVGMLTGPINSVILSYISKWQSSKKNILNKILLLGIILCVAGYGVTLLLSRPLIGLLFPQWVDDVMHYIPITTVNVLLLALISIISPFILKFCDIKWQIAINGVGVVFYFAGALVLWYFFGLMGFCFGATIGTVTKLLIMLVIYYRVDKAENNIREQ